MRVFETILCFAFFLTFAFLPEVQAQQYGNCPNGVCDVQSPHLPQYGQPYNYQQQQYRPSQYAQQAPPMGYYRYTRNYGLFGRRGSVVWVVPVAPTQYRYWRYDNVQRGW